MELFHELAGASGALVCEKGSFGSLEAYRFDAIENSCFSVPSEIEKASWKAKFSLGTKPRS